MPIYSDYSDNKLVELLKNSDHLAFEEIYNRYKAVLYIHVFKRLGDREETKDLIQELFSLLWSRRMEFMLDNSLSGYLYKSVKNRIINNAEHKRVKDIYYSSLQNILDHPQVTTDSYLMENDLMVFISKEIEELPRKMREVFQLSRMQHLSHREIAEKLNISEMTVKKQVNNALKILRVKLGPLLCLFFL